MKRNGHICKLDVARAVLKAASGPIDFATFHQRIEKRLQRIIGRQDLRMMISTLKRLGELTDEGRGETRKVRAA